MLGVSLRIFEEPRAENVSSCFVIVSSVVVVVVVVVVFVGGVYRGARGLFYGWIGHGIF